MVFESPLISAAFSQCLLTVTWLAFISLHQSQAQSKCLPWLDNSTEPNTCLPQTDSYVTLPVTELAECSRECLRHYPGCGAANFEVATATCQLFKRMNESSVIRPCSGVTFIRFDNQAIENLVLDDSLSTVRCDSRDWKFWNGWCYQYVTQQRNFDYAVYYCHLRDANLVSIHSYTENRLVASLTSHGKRVLTGLIKEKGNRLLRPNFRWTDHSPVDYFQWQIGQPDGLPFHQSNCVFLNAGNEEKAWVDDDCYQTAPFVCKKRAKIV